jgi:hypothetical protein
MSAVVNNELRYRRLGSMAYKRVKIDQCLPRLRHREQGSKRGVVAMRLFQTFVDNEISCRR